MSKSKTSQSPIRVLLMDWVNPDEAELERSRFGSEGVSFDVVHWQPVGSATLAQNDCEPYDAIIQYHGGIRLREPVEWFKNCKILVRAGVGFDNIDLAAWGSRGVPVTNVPDYGTNEVADHAIALMLALARGAAQFDADLRADFVTGWKHDAPPLIRRLSGSVFGLVGMGPIGMAAAKRAAAFGMEVVFLDPFLPAGIELALGYRRVFGLADLMGLADVVSVHAPGGLETKNMLGAEAFAASKRGQIIVNTARGSIVDLDALAEGIRRGQIGGAALDVFPSEPPDIGHPLIRAWQEGQAWIRGRLVITPHAAFYSPTSTTDVRQKAVEQVVNYVRFGQLTSCVNRRNMTAHV